MSYIPYGKEWEREISNLSKAELIEMIKKLGKQSTTESVTEKLTRIKEQYVTKKEFDAMAEVIKHHIIRIRELEKRIKQLENDEPYFGWCNVEGCEKEGCSGGNAWRGTGYWTVCDKHADDFRAGKPQPKMKQSAIDKENSRDKKTGQLPISKNVL